MSRVRHSAIFMRPHSLTTDPNLFLLHPRRYEKIVYWVTGQIPRPSYKIGDLLYVKGENAEKQIAEDQEFFIWASISSPPVLGEWGYVLQGRKGWVYEPSLRKNRY